MCETLTLHQPWASLIALGVKTVETRSWSTRYRGRLVIHAGANRRQWYAIERGTACREEDAALVEPLVEADLPHVPFGAIVATCKVVDVVPIERQRSQWVNVVWASEGRLLRDRGWPHGPVDITDQLPYGDFTPGRYAWLLDDIKPTTERCPACWGARFTTSEWQTEPGFSPADTAGPARYVGEGRGDMVKCPNCDGTGRCDPVPARGRRGLWDWEPTE